MRDHELNVVRSEIAHWLEQLGRPVMGIVSSYDPVHYAAKVKLDPEFPDPDQPGNVTESGWLPIMTHWSGNGWGCYSPPSIGDQVPVIFLENHGGSGFIIGRCFDWPAHVPAAVNSGEYWLVHKTGSYIKLTNDGKIVQNSTVEIDAGNLANPTQQVCLADFFNWAATHTHPGTGAPSSAPPSSGLTTIFKAN